jgi:hypothetical protein
VNFDVDLNRIRVTAEQMGHLIRALEDLKQNVLPKDPKLFALMSEAPLDDLERLRTEIVELVQRELAKV